MIKLFDISKLRYYVAYHSGKKFWKMSKNINLFDFYHFGHFWMSHHMINTKFRNISKISILSYVEGPSHMCKKGMDCQSRVKGRLSQWSEGRSDHRHFGSSTMSWFAQKEQNTVFCKLSIIVSFKHFNYSIYATCGMRKTCGMKCHAKRFGMPQCGIWGLC
jgi:hypothetical protein